MDTLDNHCVACSHNVKTNECLCLCCCQGEFRVKLASCNWGLIERASVDPHGEPIPSVMRKIIERFAPKKEEEDAENKS